MKKKQNVCILMLLCAVSSSVLAMPQSWLSTRYRADIWSSGSWYRSPVTNGHLDLMLFVDNVTFTEAEFSVRYDSSLINSASLLDLMPGLTLGSITTEDLEGTWKKTTLVLTGEATLGQVQYESEAILRLRLLPLAEGTMPVTLWPAGRYPEQYNTCSLILRNNGQVVQHERKEWNDGTQLFTFTDKTGATVFYHFDFNFGNPVPGFLRVTYNDQTVEEFHASDPARGISIDPEYGSFFVTGQPNAVSHTLVFPGYENVEVGLSGGWSVSHTQPSGMFWIPEAQEGFHGLEATTNDIVLTIEHPGIGTDFETSQYDAAIAGEQVGILNKTYGWEYVSDDIIKVTLFGGLAPDFNYNLYIYKDGLILGRAWFSASIYYPVTFTIQDEGGAPLPDTLVRLPMWGMFGPSSHDLWTDENGQAVFRMPGNPEWGSYQDYRVIRSGYTGVSDFVEVFDMPVEVPVVLTPAPGVTLADFAEFAAWWQNTECGWNSDCNGADLDYSGTVDQADLLLFTACWLR